MDAKHWAVSTDLLRSRDSAFVISAIVQKCADSVSLQFVWYSDIHSSPLYAYGLETCTTQYPYIPRLLVIVTDD